MTAKGHPWEPGEVRREERPIVVISSTFYVQIFCANVVLAAFSSYVLALAKNLYKKCGHITLLNLTTVVNLTNIFWAAFAPIYSFANK